MHERLSALVPPPPPRPPGVVPPTPVDELTRILSLPSRNPYDCQRDPVTKRYVPRTQALIEHETAKFTRGPRVSCACRPRRVTKLNAETLVVTRVLPSVQKQEPPQVIALADFVRDCYYNKVTNKITTAEDETRRAVLMLGVGESIELPPAGGGAGHPCISELNPTQAWILNEAAQVGGLVAFAGAGSGKTYAWLLAPLLFADGRLAVLLIEPKQRWHYRAHYLRLREHFRVPTIVFDNDETLIVDGTVPVHLVSYSVLSLTKNSDLLDRKSPDILVLDECFPSETEILTDRGMISIGEIVKNELRLNVLSRDAAGVLEWKPIVRWLRRNKPTTLVRVIHEKGSFVCTPTHKIWTENQDFVEARSLGPTDVLTVELPAVPQEILVADERAEHSSILFPELLLDEHQQSFREQEETSRGVQEDLTCAGKGEAVSQNVSNLPEGFFLETQRQEKRSTPVLFEDMCGGVPVSARHQATKDVGDEKPSVGRAYETKQPDVGSGLHREDEGVEREMDVPLTRWQREVDGAATKARSRVGWSPSWLENGASNQDSAGQRAISVVAEALQSRFGTRQNEDSDRGRWGESQDEKVAVSRSTEDRDTQCSRVVRVEILEPGSDGRFENCLGEDEAVYDLEVADNHNYFADGVLVSNCHRACGESAINRRVKRYIAGKIREREAAMARGERVRARAVRLLDGSGTLENKSVQDSQMLCTYSLGTGSPLPVDPDVAVQFSAVIDPSRRPDRDSKLARRLHDVWGDGAPDADASFADLLVDSPESRVREGFCKRRKETLGIVTTWASTVNSAIYFSERKAPKIPPEVKAALEMVAQGLRPDGEVLVDRMHEVACAREIAAGFYNRWIFPKHPCSAPPGTECVPRCKQCLLIDHWFACRKLYNKESRAKLRAGELKLDSPELCEQAAERAWSGPACPLETYCADCLRGDPSKGVPPLAVAWPCVIPDHMPAWRCQSWPAWRDIEPKVEYKESVKWLSDYLAADAAKWAQSTTGIVWFRSTPFGRRVQELSGLPYFNGGPGCENRLHAEKGDRSIICSIKALGAGTDGLQGKFYRALIAEMPASNGGNEGAEQLFARLHREGQLADVVEYEGYFHVPEFRDALRQVIVEAEWSKEMTTNPQRILTADKDFSWL